MIVIGVDVHKHSLRAVAVDEAGRMLDEMTVAAADEELLVWAGGLDGERLWAVEDCRQLTRWLERQLLAAGERLVRVPPKLIAPERRAGRVACCRSLTRVITELDDELEQRTAETAPALLDLPGYGPLTAAKLLAEVGPIDRFQTDAQLARHSGVAPLQASSSRVQRHRPDRGGNRQLNAAIYRIAITQARVHPAARAYLERKQAEGKSRREAIRCLKRQLARVVFNTLKASPALT
jgi:transposase